VTYQVRLESFEGPFDLLLHLISKREVDIFQVRVADIVEDYLQVLSEATEFDLEVATEFLLVAATLLEIKSHRLLPSHKDEDHEGDDLSDRDLLIARLLQYKAFKDASVEFSRRIAENAGFHARTIGPGSDFAHLAPDLLARCPLPKFAEIARRVLTPREEPVLDLSHLTPIRITLSEAIATVEALLASRKSITFRELNGDSPTRLDVVVRFLALLELVKAGTVEAIQAETFGDIEIRAVEESPIPTPTASVREDA
jgi:segregation and condensation protein A